MSASVARILNILANNSTKSCLAYTLGSWRRKLGSGDRSTKFVQKSRVVIHRFINVYQALQLLEYIIKHGSERVVDDARSHISTIKMLRNFHYIDEKGKDEGINGKHHLMLCLVHS